MGFGHEGFVAREAERGDLTAARRLGVIFGQERFLRLFQKGRVEWVGLPGGEGGGQAAERGGQHHGREDELP